MILNGLKCKGTVRGYDKDSGKLLFQHGNMFMNTALEQVAKWIAGDNTIKIPMVVKVGNSNAAVAMGQLALSGDVLGTKTLESAEATGASVEFVASFLAGEGTGVWEEVGLFDADDKMWSRALTGTYTKKDLDKIEVHWTYDFYDSSETAPEETII